MGAPGGEKGGKAGQERSGQNFIFSVVYDGASPSMETINGYLDYLNQTWSGELKPFGWEHGLGLSLGWQLSPVFEVGLTFNRSSARLSGSLDAVGSVYTSSHTLSTYGLYLSARSKEIFAPARLLARTALFYGRAHYEETENGFITAGNDGTVGFSIAVGPEFEVSSIVSFFFLAGYRQANFDGFEVSFFMPGSPPVNLQFSGFSLQAGLSVRF